MSLRPHATPQYSKETQRPNAISTFFNMTKTNRSDAAPPVPPVRPDNDECCHSGCEPCIFDLYELEMERYRVALKEWESRRTDSKSRKKILCKASPK